jgi:PleD family two-component response regulator
LPDHADLARLRRLPMMESGLIASHSSFGLGPIAVCSPQDRCSAAAPEAAAKILIVEDTKSIREIVAFMLRSKGYETVESGDGQDAEHDRRAADHPEQLRVRAYCLHRDGE